MHRMYAGPCGPKVMMHCGDSARSVPSLQSLHNRQMGSRREGQALEFKIHTGDEDLHFGVDRLMSQESSGGCPKVRKSPDAGRHPPRACR